MRLRITVVFLALLALALPACAEQPSQALNGTVTWVHDGDTLEVRPLGTVRLIGIDTPEREDSPRDNFLKNQGISSPRQREIYQAAKMFNIRNVKGLDVHLSLDQPERDRHGRLLVYVILPDGRNLNQVLIENGLAVVYRKFSFRMKDEFIASENMARAARRGLWSETGAE